jgi:hypothetical protein
MAKDIRRFPPPWSIIESDESSAEIGIARRFR